MNIALITPPPQPVVDGADLAAWLRTDSLEDRAQLVALEQSAVAYLDGWGGLLGRAILPQVWRQEFCGWGTLRLAMPDVTAFTVTALDAAGGAVSATRAELRSDLAGPYVLTEGPAVDRVFVQFTCALPSVRLPAVQTAIKLIVAHWFMNREAVVTGTVATELPMSAMAVLDTLRWRRG